MKAIVLTRTGAPDQAFEIQEKPTPHPAEGEVLIKSEGFGLNFADTMARKGLYQDAPPRPSVLGYEVVGRIEAIGTGVDAEWLGKRVVAFTRFGGYAEYAVASVMGMAPITEEMEAAAAAALATQYGTAYYAAYEVVNLHKGDVILVHSAAGGVGTALVQLCRLKGCEIIGTGSNAEKLAFIKENGADHAVNYLTNDYYQEVKALLGKRRLAVAFNAVGGKTFKKDKALLGAGGRLVLYGAAERTNPKWGFLSTLKFVWDMGLIIPATLIMSSKSIIGVNMLRVADYQPHILGRCIHALSDLMEAGKLNPKVGGVFPYTAIGKAHHFLESRQSIGKVFVEWKA